MLTCLMDGTATFNLVDYILIFEFNFMNDDSEKANFQAKYAKEYPHNEQLVCYFQDDK